MERNSEDMSQATRWPTRIAIVVSLLGLTLAGGTLLLSHADGPVFIFAGGPFRSGAQADFAELDWTALDTALELELEIVEAARSRTLWFSVHNGAAYVACDLDCVDGKLSRWPQQIEADNRVVVRIGGRRVDGRLIHVPHASAEYEVVQQGRSHKYSGAQGGRAAAESKAHSAVIDVGEILTGRSKRSEPGDRLFRFDPR